MTWQQVLLAAAGGGLSAAGLVLLVGVAPALASRIRHGMNGISGSTLRRGVLLIVAALATWTATGWVVGGVLAAAAAWWLPRLLGPDRGVLAEADRAEAVASWAAQLRDLIAGSAGLYQALFATAETAPAPIRAEVAEVVQSLRGGERLSDAMSGFAARVDTPTADLVAVALSTAEGRHAADLAALLGRLADASRDRAHMLARTSASRARVRSSVRIIAGASLAMVAGLVLFNRPYLAPFDTVTGQGVLAIIGLMWAVGLAWLARLAAPAVQPRMLAPAASQHVRLGSTA